MYPKYIIAGNPLSGKGRLRMGMAAFYIIATVVVCVAMAWLGYRLGQSR